MTDIKYADDKYEKWEDFFREAPKKYKSNSEKKWIFRGNKPGKPLTSSLDRAFKYYPPDIGKKSEVEGRLLREFERRYHQYSSDAPKDNDYLEWFSIMQHYGAPTRLLDFTYSIYVAAYFALEHVSDEPMDINHFEVFAVNSKWAIQQSVKNNNYGEAKNFFSDLINNTPEDLKNFEKFFIKNYSVKFVCPFNPFRLNERISLQNGVFMCPGNADDTFEDNLWSLGGGDNEGAIVRLVLNFDRSETIKAREHLYDLNITRTTLFPGLAGFAGSLKIYPPKMLIENEVLKTDWLSNIAKI
jgi:hypothetical protein